VRGGNESRQAVMVNQMSMPLRPVAEDRGGCASEQRAIVQVSAPDGNALRASPRYGLGTFSAPRVTCHGLRRKVIRDGRGTREVIANVYHRR